MGFGPAPDSFFEALADKSKEPKVITDVTAEIIKLQEKLKQNPKIRANEKHTYTYISNVEVDATVDSNEYTVTLSSVSYTK